MAQYIWELAWDDRQSIWSDEHGFFSAEQYEDKDICPESVRLQHKWCNYIRAIYSLNAH